MRGLSGRRNLVSESDTGSLPNAVTHVPLDLIRNYPHSKRVGHYLIGKVLGEGSFAKVKEAVHVLTGEKVAVKIIDKNKAKKDVYLKKNLEREGRLMQRVGRHPNIVNLYQIMETENSYYLVIERCQGGEMLELICRLRCLTEERTSKYISHMIMAVHYLHTIGIIHRDLKIENLLLDENDQIKIIDFGLSNSINVEVSTDGTSVSPLELCVTQCGSPAYAAPELLSQKKYGPEVDVWSIGINMYAMLVGKLPFTMEPFNIRKLHKKMLDGQINEFPDTLSAEAKDLILKFLNANPNTRITLKDAIKHPWFQKEGAPTTTLSSLKKIHPNYRPEVTNFVAKKLSIDSSELIRQITKNIASASTALYTLLCKKLDRYYNKQRMEEHKMKAIVNGEINMTSRNVSYKPLTPSLRTFANTPIQPKTDSDKNIDICPAPTSFSRHSNPEETRQNQSQEIIITEKEMPHRTLSDSSATPKYPFVHYSELQEYQQQNTTQKQYIPHPPSTEYIKPTAKGCKLVNRYQPMSGKLPMDQQIYKHLPFNEQKDNEHVNETIVINNLRRNLEKTLPVYRRTPFGNPAKYSEINYQSTEPIHVRVYSNNNKNQNLYNMTTTTHASNVNYLPVINTNSKNCSNETQANRVLHPNKPMIPIIKKSNKFANSPPVTNIKSTSPVKINNSTNAISLNENSTKKDNDDRDTPISTDSSQQWLNNLSVL